jgi:hypothetical protein
VSSDKRTRSPKEPSVVVSADLQQMVDELEDHGLSNKSIFDWILKRQSVEECEHFLISRLSPPSHHDRRSVTQPGKNGTSS